MGVSPGHGAQSWRGSYLQSGAGSGGGVQARSQFAKVLNAVIVLCGVSYLLYICVLALDPRTLLSTTHNAYRLRVRVRSNHSSGAAAARPAQQLLHIYGRAGQQQQAVEQPVVLPGSNQAPALEQDMQHNPDKIPADPLAIVVEEAARSSRADAKAGDGEQQNIVSGQEDAQGLQQQSEEQLDEEQDEEDDAEERAMER